MRANADIFYDSDQLRRPLMWSLGLHVLLFGGLLLYSAVLGRGGQAWGGTGGGGAMSANIVSTIPLPAREPGPNIVAVESPGRTISLPPTTVEPPPDAIPIPAPDVKKTAPAPSTATTAKRPVRLPTPTEQLPNVVPFGQGGPVSGPYGVFSAGGAKGGLAFEGAGGDFGSRYGWYVDVVRRKVSENWLRYEVDPSIVSAKRVYITFEIQRNGMPRNIQISQSSGVPSLDQSALRALQRIDTFGPLPNDYRGSSVAVEFWFDYQR